MAIDTRIELDPIFGDISSLVSVVPQCKVKISDLIGNIKPLITVVTPEVRCLLPNLIGIISAQAIIAPRVRVKFLPLFELYARIERVRIFVNPNVDHWAANGFPPLNADYTYTKPAGLVRTQMDSGYVRQRRKWNGESYRTVTLNCTIKVSSLQTLSTFLSTFNYDWFSAVLVTEDSGSQEGSNHFIRIIGDVTIRNADADWVNISFPAEIQ